MTSSAKTLGTAVFAGLAIPVGGISGIGAVGSLLALVFSSSSRTGGMVLFFLAAASVFGATFYLLTSLQKKGKQLVLDINQRESLSLDPINMLGYPSPAFVVFDRAQRRIAVCNSSTSDYQIYDASYVLGWHYTWTNRESMEIAGPGNRIGDTRLHAPAFERVERRTNFTLVLEVSNVARPMLKFPMSERAAIEWCARLNAIFNG